MTSTMNTTTNNNTAAAAAAAVVAATGAECIHAVGACSISISAPEGSQAYKTGERGGMYSFSRVSGPRTEQGNFFEGTAAPLVRAMVNGGQSENVIMSYGVTSSGKTYTIEGTQQAPGLIYRAVATLFKELDEQRKVGAEVFVSHYEVYNEQIFDLLTNGNPIGGRRCLQLKEDAAGRPTIMGLTDVRVPTAQAAMDTLRRGNANRSQATTTLNLSSSRSHSVFAVTLQTPAAVDQNASAAAVAAAAAAAAGVGAGVPGVAFRNSQQQQQQQGGGGRGAVSTSVLQFVDLAGSERARRTGNVGDRLKEATAINSSLMCLGRCLEALRWNQKHGDKRQLKRVPYRESKITHLFKSALHGWGRIMLIVNVSAAAADSTKPSTCSSTQPWRRRSAPRLAWSSCSPHLLPSWRERLQPSDVKSQPGGLSPWLTTPAPPGGEAAGRVGLFWVEEARGEEDEEESPAPPSYQPFWQPTSRGGDAVGAGGVVRAR